MSKYAIEAALPSVNITKDFLQDLETYLIAKSAEVTTEPVQEARKNYIVRITDSLGSHELASVTDYKFAFYPSDTKAIVFQRGIVPGLHWEISLGTEDAKFRMSLEREGAKEIVYGIRHEIMDLFNRYGNHNWVFQNNLLQASAFLASSLTPMLLPMTWSSAGKPFVLAFGALGIAFLVTGRIFKPYCVFPTRRNESRQHWFKWFVMGCIGFLIFTVGGVWLRKSLLHF